MPWYRMVKYFDEKNKKFLELDGVKEPVIFHAIEDESGNPKSIVVFAPIEAMTHEQVVTIAEKVAKHTEKNVLLLGHNIRLMKITPITEDEASEYAKKISALPKPIDCPSQEKGN